MRVLQHDGFIDLRAALRLDPETDVHCLAFMSNNRVCWEIPDAPVSTRNEIIRKISSEMRENGSILASERMPLLLEQLARTLICDEKPHKLQKKGKPCNQIEHVSDILQHRLEVYRQVQLESRRQSGAQIRARPQASQARSSTPNGGFEEDSDASYRPDPGEEEDTEGEELWEDDLEEVLKELEELKDDWVGTSVPLEKKKKQKKQQKKKMEDDDEEEEEEEEDDDDSSEREMARARRPKLARRPAAAHPHQVKRSPRSSLKKQRSTPESKRFQKRSPRNTFPDTDESDAPTPETVNPTVFSPLSPSLSAYSDESVMTPGTRKNGRRAGWQQSHETPTRRRRESIQSVEADGYWVTDDEDGGDHYGESEPSHLLPDDSDTEEKYESDSVHSGDEGNPFDQHHRSDAESEPEIRRAFERMKNRPQPVQSIMKAMQSAIKRNPPGYIYCFTDRGLHGYLKIGFSGIDEIRKENAGDPADMSDDSRSRLWRRLMRQKKECDYNIEMIFDEYIPCAVRKIETLVHATLHEHRWRVTTCPCGNNHREWFTTTMDEVVAVINRWKEFSELSPWDDSGHLEKVWHTYVSNNFSACRNMSVESWMDGPWQTLVDDVRQLKSENIQNIESKLDAIEKREEELKQKKLKLKQKAIRLHVKKIDGERRAMRQEKRELKQQLEELRGRLVQRRS